MSKYGHVERIAAFEFSSYLCITGEGENPAIGWTNWFAPIDVLPPGRLSITRVCTHAAVIVGPIMWAGGSLYSAHRADLPRTPSLASALQMLCASVLALPLAFIDGEFPRFDPAAIRPEGILALLYLVTFGSILALPLAPFPAAVRYRLKRKGLDWKATPAI